MLNSEKRYFYQPKSIYNFVIFLQARGMKISVFKEFSKGRWILEKEGISMRFNSTYDIGCFLEPIYEAESEKTIVEHFKAKIRRELEGATEAEKRYIIANVKGGVQI